VDKFLTQRKKNGGPPEGMYAWGGFLKLNTIKQKHQ
jgi:hypothetical protein